MGSSKYVRYTSEQVEALERVYIECPKPGFLRCQQLIRECPILSNIEPKQIKVWFQNRRLSNLGVESDSVPRASLVGQGRNNMRLFVNLTNIEAWSGRDGPIECWIQAANLVTTIGDIMAELDAEFEYDSAEENVIWQLVKLLSSETSADDVPDPELSLPKRQLKISCAEALWTLAPRNVSNSAAESDVHFRRAIFKINFPSAKAVVDQLLRVTKESNDHILQIPAIKSIDSLARTFPSRATQVIGLLVSLIDNTHQTVETEAAIALQKLRPENYHSREHWKSIIEFNGVPALMRLIRGGNKML
ncbi:hypothetical protein REPUB_Repub09cG0019000 [Reevesia pubescens]